MAAYCAKTPLGRRGVNGKTLAEPCAYLGAITAQQFGQWVLPNCRLVNYEYAQTCAQKVRIMPSLFKRLRERGNGPIAKDTKDKQGPPKSSRSVVVALPATPIGMAAVDR